MTAFLSSHLPYFSFVALLVIGSYLILTRGHLLRDLVGLYLIQASAILFFVQLAWRTEGTAPILEDSVTQASVNPLPHAMMLTAIVVGVATLGVGMSLLRRIYFESGSLQDTSRQGDEE